MSTTTVRRFTGLTAMAKAHLLSEGFKLDGSDTIIDIFDTVYDFLLADLTVHDRMLVDDAYHFVGTYDELAQIITENLA